MKTLSVLALSLTIAAALPVNAEPPSSVISRSYTPPPSAGHQHRVTPSTRGMTNQEKRESGSPGFVPWHRTPNRQPGSTLWHCDQSRINDDECTE